MVKKKIVNHFNQKIPFHGIYKILCMKTIFFLCMLIQGSVAKINQMKTSRGGCLSYQNKSESHKVALSWKKKKLRQDGIHALLNDSLRI